MSTEISQPDFTRLIDLIAARFGGKTLEASDDFFAPKENLLKPGRGVFIPDKYTENGKWMDGWESRRKRTPGNDWCIIALGTPGVIGGFDVDTNHFLGNHPPHCSIEGCFQPNPSGPFYWSTILPKVALNPGSQNFFPVDSKETYSHLRLNIFPDGGVARLRAYGRARPLELSAEQSIDLAAADQGGLAVACSDMFFSNMNNLIMPGRGINMGDGWETKRRRGPGHDWVIVSLGKTGNLTKVEVDTKHFKGNYPDSCSLEGSLTNSPTDANTEWKTIIPQSKLSADHQHEFTELQTAGPFNHLRLNIFPDGGVSRLRAYGFPQDGKRK